MADILSLSKARKARARVEKEAKATENRIRFGRSKAEKSRAAAEKALAATRLEGARRPDEE